MIRLQLWLLRHQISFFIKKRDYARMMVVCLFFVILTLLAFFSFILGRLFMDYMGSFGTFSKSFLYLTLLSLTSSLSILSLISFTIAFAKTLFDKILIFFFLYPSRLSKLALLVLAATLVFGSWPYFLISLPFFFGMLKISGIPLGSYLGVIILHLLISVILGIFGGILAIFLFLTFGRRLTHFLPIVLMASLLGLFFLFTKFIFPANLEHLYFQSLPLALPYLPTTLFVESFLGKSLSGVFLFGEACLAVVVFILTARLFYKKTWQVNFEGYLVADDKLPSSLVSLPQFPKALFPKSVYFAFIKKETLSFRRTANAVIYLSFIIFLAALFTFFLTRASGLQSEYAQFIPVVKLAVFFVVSYLTLLFTIRFVFPTFAIERSFIWSIITTIAIRHRLSVFKWTFYQGAVLLFTVILGVVSWICYKIPGVKIGNLLPLFLSNAVLTSTFTLMAGQVFQRELPKENIEDISTTIPGILVTVFSLVSGLIIAFLFFFFSTPYLSWILLGIAVVFLFWGYQFSCRHYKQSDI